MDSRPFIWRCCACAATIFYSGTITSAATLGSDYASNSPYADGWQSGDNGGTGFNAWNLTAANGNAGFFIGDSTTLNSGNTGANINSGGKSFGQYGHDGTYSFASRSLTSALNVGQQFSLDLAVNFRNGAKGVDVFDSSGNKVFNFNVGGDDYSVSNAATNNGSIGNAYSSNKAFRILFVQSSSSGGKWTISNIGTPDTSKSGTYSGLFNAFQTYEGATNGGSEDNLYSNDFVISNSDTTPELSTPMMFGSGTLLMGLMRRRRRFTDAI